ncbi:MAG: PG0541 family transporter-associated protein [Armatimonadota bacterium]
MKLVTVVYDTGAETLVEEALEKVGAGGWTRVLDVAGKGRAGLRLGDAIFPGLNNLMFSVIEDEKVAPLKIELEQIPDEFIKQLAFRVFVSDCEILI